MKIYLDMVFALNGLINYLLLRASAALFGISARRWRAALAAAFGAAYACVTFLPGLSFLSGFIWRLAALTIMLALAYGVTKRAVYPGVGFAALSMALSGLILMLGSGRVQLLGGRAYYALGFPALVLTAGFVYLAVRLLLRGVLQHTGGIVQAELTLLGRMEQLCLLRDTGNTLRDPFTGKALPVVERQVITRLLPEAGRVRFENPVEAMEQLHAIAPEAPVRLIPYRAVGTQRALLLAVRCDALRIRGKERNHVFVAISPTKVSENEQYEGLIGEGD